jgi:hypothetical protein
MGVANNKQDRLTAMEVQLDNVVSGQKELKEVVKGGFERNDKKHEELMKHFTDELCRVSEQFNRQLETKAGVWVEKVMWSIGGIVGTALIGAILSLILIK